MFSGISFDLPQIMIFPWIGGAKFSDNIYFQIRALFPGKSYRSGRVVSPKIDRGPIFIKLWICNVIGGGKFSGDIYFQTALFHFCHKKSTEIRFATNYNIPMKLGVLNSVATSSTNSGTFSFFSRKTWQIRTCGVTKIDRGPIFIKLVFSRILLEKHEYSTSFNA